MKNDKQKALDDLVRTHLAIPDDIKRLIALATSDLFSGPIGDTDEDSKPWPGFERACAQISAFLDERSTLWIDFDCDYVTDTEPDWSDEDSSQWYSYDSRDIKRAACGQELAGYV